MIRFPNPGSDITNFVAVFNAAFEELDGQLFDLDAMVAAVVRENLATSSGHVGEEAISRSTRQDRARDPLYNQLKMYSELYRALGWIHSTEQSTLNFTFTLLGRQVIAAGQHYRPLLQETVLGIAYPSRVLDVRGDYIQRPFAFLLSTMLACDNALSRDEMIVGPLSAESDQSHDAVADMATLIQPMRESPEATKDALDGVATQQGIQVNTLWNYTRWPIAIMRHLGWTQKGRRMFKNGGKSFEVHELTERGQQVANWVRGATDLRYEQIAPHRGENEQKSLWDAVDQSPDRKNRLSVKEMTAVSVHSHYRMLERAGFELESVVPVLEEQEQVLTQVLAKLNLELGRPLLFSPFQSLSIPDITEGFPCF